MGLLDSSMDFLKRVLLLQHIFEQKTKRSPWQKKQVHRVKFKKRDWREKRDRKNAIAAMSRKINRHR